MNGIKRISRRSFLLAAGVATLACAPGIARAQAYPARPVRIIVAFAAGGGVDIASRLIGQWLSDRLGQPFIIENRPGGGTKKARPASRTIDDLLADFGTTMPRKAPAPVAPPAEKLFPHSVNAGGVRRVGHGWAATMPPRRRLRAWPAGSPCRGAG